MTDTKKTLLDHLQIKFKNPKLLDLALTHRSFVHEQKLPLDQSNERLEFLGDAVLGICIAEMLVHSFPDEAEGALSKRRAALVNQKQLAKIAESMELGAALHIGKGEEKTGGRQKKSLLCDAFEAVIGAIYMDQGMEVTKKQVHRYFSTLIPESKKVETSEDYKTRLQEFFQGTFRKSPKYIILSESGPDHSKTFEVKIELDGKPLATGKGSSKRAAEQEAAKAAFKLLKVPENSIPTKKRRAHRKKKKLLSASATKSDPVTKEPLQKPRPKERETLS
jgi:ribonuclease III